MKHDYVLKCSEGPFRSVWRGQKKAEVRRNDRGYQVGDRILLVEHDGERHVYPFRTVLVEITHIINGGQYGIAPEFCVWSFKVLQRKIGTHEAKP